MIKISNYFYKYFKIWQIKLGSSLWMVTRNRDVNENAARVRFLLRNENKNPSERRIAMDSPDQSFRHKPWRDGITIK